MSATVTTTRLAARALAAAGAAFFIAVTMAGCTTARVPIGPNGQPVSQGPAIGSTSLVSSTFADR